MVSEYLKNFEKNRKPSDLLTSLMWLKFWSILKKNTLVNINFNVIFVMSFIIKKLIWMNTIQLFILHQLMKSQWKMKMSSKKSSWCCAIYYYSLTQTSILWNGNCASGYRALKVSSNLEKFPFLECASGYRALNFLGNFLEFSESFLESVWVGAPHTHSHTFLPCYDSHSF